MGYMVNVGLSIFYWTLMFHQLYVACPLAYFYLEYGLVYICM